MKNHFTFKIIFFIFSTLFLGSGFANAQKPVNIDKAEDVISGIKERIFGDIYQQQHMTSVEITEFNKLYEDSIAKYQRLLLKRLLKNLSFSDAQQLQYIDKAETYYTQLYYNYKRTKAEFPSAIADAMYKPHGPVSGTCNPACTNIDFENGDLSGWTACYANCNAESTGSPTAFTYTTPTCFGVLGAGVTRSANDPATSSYQVSMTSAGINDPVAGAAIPEVQPGWGNHACRIGDSTKVGFGVAFLEQTFQVTTTNEDLYYSYAVVLENPTGHAYYQQPYFSIAFLDQNGDTIPLCGNYLVVSGSGTTSWSQVQYQGSTTYYLPWQNAEVSLKKYLGTCVTIIVRSSDCGQGGHFGYGYFDTKCESRAIVASSPGFCGSSITLTAPGGAKSYKWTGPCITGSDSAQTITIGCTGKYSVIMKSIFGSACSDTLDTVINAGTGTAPFVNFTNDTVCAGNPMQFTNLTTPTSGNTYNWNFGYGGDVPADSSHLTNPTFTYPTAGTYTVTLQAVNGGCGKDTTKQVLVKAPPASKISAANNPACSTSTTDSLTASPSGGSFSGKGVTGNNFDPSIAGIGNFYIHYILNDSVNCSINDSILVSVQVCTGIGNVKPQIQEIQCYPSPFSNSVSIDLNSKLPATATLFNMLGQSMGSWMLDKAHNNINTESIPSGAYLLQVQSKEKLFHKKIIKVN